MTSAGIYKAELGGQHFVNAKLQSSNNQKGQGLLGMLFALTRMEFFRSHNKLLNSEKKKPGSWYSWATY